MWICIKKHSPNLYNVGSGKFGGKWEVWEELGSFGESGKFEKNWEVCEGSGIGNELRSSQRVARTAT